MVIAMFFVLCSNFTFPPPTAALMSEEKDEIIAQELQVLYNGIVFYGILEKWLLTGDGYLREVVVQGILNTEVWLCFCYHVLQLAQAEKEEILLFESHLAAATTKVAITESNSLLLSQLISMDPV